MGSLEQLQERIEQEGPDGSWSINDLDPNLFNRNQLSEIWPPHESTYEHLYRRGAGKGDLFDSFAKRKTPVPVNFTFVKYQRPKSYDRFEALFADEDEFNGFGVPQTREEWRELIEDTRNDIVPLVEGLDEAYASATEGRLRFVMGKVKTRIFHTLDGAFFLPYAANTLGTTSSLQVKVHAILTHDGMPYSGYYHGRGLIDLDYPHTARGDTTLIHEVGHGIIGLDHHEKRNCVMDNNFNQGHKPFCTEDLATIRRMVGLVHPPHTA
jgi:hypothetical protein